MLIQHLVVAQEQAPAVASGCGWLQQAVHVRPSRSRRARNSTSRGWRARCWPPSTSSVVPVMAGDSSRKRTARAMSSRRRRALQRRHARARRANSSSVIGPDGSVTPGRHADTRARVGASACASSVVAASQRGLRQRVRQVVGVRVPQLLVEQVDHAAAARRRAAGARAAPAPAARPARCWRASGASIAGVAEAVDVVVLEERGVVDHRVERARSAAATAGSSARAAGLVGQVGGEGVGARAEPRALGDAACGLGARAAVVHARRRSRARRARARSRARGAARAGDEHDGTRSTCVPTMRAMHGATEPTVYRPPCARLIRAGHRRAPAAGCRSTASWRWRCTRRASATTRGGRKFGAHAGVGQRLRHRARAVAAVRPRAGAPGRRRRWTRAAPTRSGSSAPAPARWPPQLLDALGERVRRYAIVELSGAAARAPARSGWRAFGDRVRWLDALPDAMRRRGGRQRGARRDAGAAAALRRRALARARRGRATAARFALADRPTRAAPAGRRRRSPPGTHRPSCTRRPRPSSPRWPSALRARRGLLRRLRLSRGRVLPPAAPRRHADVPPRAPRRHRSAGRRRR